MSEFLDNDSKRTEAIKKIIRMLHEGKTVEELQAEYGHIIAATAAGIPGSSLGRIYIQNHRTTVDVSDQYIDKIVSANNKFQVRGQSFTLTKG